MQAIRIAAAQFENKNNDKEYNLHAMDKLTEKAVRQDADVISFHEGCVSAYSFARKLTREEFFALGEEVPNGPSVRRLMEISKKHGIPVLAGLVELDGDRVFNTYVCVDGDELVMKFRKLHAFIHPALSCGDEYVTFDLKGWKCSSLICYDNNIPENVISVANLGADIVFMPHVTCCLNWPAPGSGEVSKELWDNRHNDPTSLRNEFDSLKSRQWLLKWLPSRAYDNGIYAVFTNPVGVDDDQIRPGNAMVLDPYGDVISECRTLGDDITVATCDPEKTKKALGRKHMAAKRPEVFKDIITKPYGDGKIDPSWDTGH